MKSSNNSSFLPTIQKWKYTLTSLFRKILLQVLGTERKASLNVVRQEAIQSEEKGSRELHKTVRE